MNLRLLVAASLAFVGAAAALGAGCGSSTPDPCFDYKTFNGSSPEVHFKADVLPIFQRSCGIASTCHSELHNSNEAQPYLGDPSGTTMGGDAILAVLDQILKVP